jgi:hypothetical protein
MSVIRLQEGRVVEVRLLEVCPIEGRPIEVRPAEVRLTEVRLSAGPAVLTINCPSETSKAGIRTEIWRGLSETVQKYRGEDAQNGKNEKQASHCSLVVRRVRRRPIDGHYLEVIPRVQIACITFHSVSPF